jgi:hypothetical protein
MRCRISVPAAVPGCRGCAAGGERHGRAAGLHVAHRAGLPPHLRLAPARQGLRGGGRRRRQARLPVRRRRQRRRQRRRRGSRALSRLLARRCCACCGRARWRGAWRDGAPRRRLSRGSAAGSFGPWRGSAAQQAAANPPAAPVGPASVQLRVRTQCRSLTQRRPGWGGRSRIKNRMWRRAVHAQLLRLLRCSLAARPLHGRRATSVQVCLLRWRWAEGVPYTRSTMGRRIINGGSTGHL